MAKKRSKFRGEQPGSDRTYRIQAFVSGEGFTTKFYAAKTPEEAFGRFKGQYPTGQAFRIDLDSGKVLPGPQDRYLVWWKRLGGQDWKPSLIFVLDPAGSVIGSIPYVGAIQLKLSWELAQKRLSDRKHKFEEVDQAMASLLGMEMLVEGERFMKTVFRDLQSGKTEFED